jgi:hypothetical protein
VQTQSLVRLNVPAVPMGVSLYWELMQGVIPDHRPLWWLALYGFMQWANLVHLESLRKQWLMKNGAVLAKGAEAANQGRPY